MAQTLPNTEKLTKKQVQRANAAIRKVIRDNTTWLKEMAKK
jgi:hypothetical protein